MAGMGYVKASISFSAVPFMQRRLTYPGSPAQTRCITTVCEKQTSTCLRPHPLLAQIPLTVSPFISLPSAPTLPYTYKPLPSTLPPSATADSNGNEREKIVVSKSGHAASPEDIIASCQALQAHIQKMQEDAERTIREWETKLKEEELAEKRRVAPGWLDRDEKILQPTRMLNQDDPSTGLANRNQSENLMDQRTEESTNIIQQTVPSQEGEELDRAFGGMSLRQG
ncbi:MAG: hypothetical protein L6R39_006839 [Caloplaca ligustica]|nr:MAG: hypothetical protein L6R39_006839 [Caloplaca ligustica]